MEKRRPKKICALVAFVLCLVLVMSQDAWYRGRAAYVITPNYDIMTDELIAEMENMDDDDITEIYLFLKGVDRNVLKRMEDEYAKQVTGIDPAVFKDDERFRDEFVSSVIDELNAERNAKADLNKDSAEVQEAIRQKIDEDNQARRYIIKYAQTKYTNDFLNKYVDTDNREISYFGHYTATLILEATKSEIEMYSTLDEVEAISLYVEHELVESTELSLNQIDA